MLARVVALPPICRYFTVGRVLRDPVGRAGVVGALSRWRHAALGVGADLTRWMLQLRPGPYNALKSGANQRRRVRLMNTSYRS